MTALVWDKIGERIFETGVDRGVLYLKDDTAVAWNGITGVEESSNPELKSLYLNGLKYLEYLSPGDYSAILKAITYPDEFESVGGIYKSINGISFYDQPVRSFSLSYRTKIGNDLDGEDHGYKIHIVYNVIADPATKVYASLGERIQPADFSWNLTGRPPDWSYFPTRPTSHIALDSRKIDPDILSSFEDILYGTESESPRLLTLEDITPPEDIP